MMKQYLTLVLMFVGTTIMFAAPVNDDCANAITLTVNPTCNFTSGTVAAATQSAAPFTCNGVTSASAFDVWYKFIAGGSSQIITVKGSGSFDAVVVLLDGCAGTSINCSNTTGLGGTEILTATGLTTGNTYYIRVYHHGSALPATLTFDICVSNPPPSGSNDNCVNAIALTVNSICTPTAGTVLGATQSLLPDTCGSFTSSTAFDVWYKFVATATNNVIKVQGAQSFDAVVSLRNTCTGSPIACSDHTTGGGIETISDSNLVIGNTYYIRVYAYGSAIPSTPDFDICVSPPPPPPAYDNCINAILLNVDPLCTYTAGSVAGATQSLLPDTCGSFTSSTAFDVWYKFVAVTGGQTITVKGSASFDAVVSLRSSCTGPVIACSDHSGSGGFEKINTVGLTPGNTYYIRVYHYGSSAPSTPGFDICVSFPPPIPLNDNCSNSKALSVGSVCTFISGTVAGATQSMLPDSCPTYASATAFDVWYKFIATASNNEITVQGSLSFDAVVSLRDSCNGPSILCSDHTGSGGVETINGNGLLVVGNTYFVRVYAYGSAEPSTAEFQICVAPPPPAPLNDNCAGAITLTANSTCSPVAGTVAGSTQSAPSDTCGNFHSAAAFDVWYKFVAVATEQTITVKGSQSFDAVLLLKDNCSSSPIECADSSTSGGTERIIANNLIIGHTYYIRVYAYGGSLPSTTDFDICLLNSSPASISVSENNNNLVNVFPNPATNKVIIGLKSANSKEAMVYKIFNVNGQLVASGQFAANDLQKEVDINSFTSGIYTIQIQIANTVVNKKIVVINK